MSQLPKISVLFRTTFIPSGASYYGVHDTTDYSFGTSQFSDPYIGNGSKLIELSRVNNHNRRLFNVTCLRIGTRKEVDEQLKRLLDNLDYTQPNILNAREGYPKGRPQSKEHAENLSAARSVAFVGNENALGRREPNIDIDTPAGTKLKWFNNSKDQKMILCDSNDNPIKPEYKEWKLGKLHKNPYVQKRLEENKEAANETESDE